jgi:hypothetical protein
MERKFYEEVLRRNLAEASPAETLALLLQLYRLTVLQHKRLQALEAQGDGWFIVAVFFLFVSVWLVLLLLLRL